MALIYKSLKKLNFKKTSLLFMNKLKQEYVACRRWEDMK